MNKHAWQNVCQRRIPKWCHVSISLYIRSCVRLVTTEQQTPLGFILKRQVDYPMIIVSKNNYVN